MAALFATTLAPAQPPWADVPLSDFPTYDASRFL